MLRTSSWWPVYVLCRLNGANSRTRWFGVRQTWIWASCVTAIYLMTNKKQITKSKTVPTFHPVRTWCPSLVCESWNGEEPHLFWNWLGGPGRLQAFRSKVKLVWQRDIPSSTVTRTLASGLSAMAAIFFRFSNENVRDLLLYQNKIIRQRFVWKAFITILD
jgi:hypothetical protein